MNVGPEIRQDHRDLAEHGTRDISGVEACDCTTFRFR